MESCNSIAAVSFGGFLGKRPILLSSDHDHPSNKMHKKFTGNFKMGSFDSGGTSHNKPNGMNSYLDTITKLDHENELSR